ncbi:WD repeat-containing protein 91 [Elysia marginata]|uniref:WD repeat-containing protein 91 n=1 Tax=Elysia marginata TaxID=1093978 RepID=A0AAV4HER4_9GAST|nr:WD repeat-containing protein 91 [Elysia marginata]
MKSLQEENISLKQQLMGVSSKSEQSRAKPRRSLHSELHPPSSTPDMVYDFSGLSSDVDQPNQEKQKFTRRFPLSLTSPLTIRKKSTTNENVQAKSKPVASVSGFVNTSVPPQGQASSSAAAQLNTRTSELTAFPPPSYHSKQADPKKPVASQTPSMPTISSLAASSSSAAAAAAAVTKHSAQPPVQGKAGAGSKSFLIPGAKSASTSSASSGDSSEAHMISRSLSTPTTKSTSSRIPMVKQISDASPQLALSESTASAITSSSNTIKRSVSPALDPNSPFLSLEDEYSEHTSAVSFCRFSQSGQHVASLDVDGIVKVWIWSPQPATSATVMSKSAFLSLAWAGKSDRWLLLGNKTGTIRLFDVKESKTFREVTVNPDNDTNCLRVTDLSSSPSGQQFVCATADHCPFSSDIATVSGRLLQWDLRTLKLERTLVVDSPVCNAVTCSSYSQTGHLLLTGGADGFVRIYDANQQRPAVKWQAHSSPIYSAVFNGDRSVLTIGAHGKLCEWSLTKPGQPLTAINTNRPEIPKVYNGSPRTCLFSIDKENQYLLTCSGHRGIIYKMSSTSPPTKVMTLKSHSSPVVTAEWSPSPPTRVCLTGSADGKIRILTLLEVENGAKKTS